VSLKFFLYLLLKKIRIVKQQQITIKTPKLSRKIFTKNKQAFETTFCFLLLFTLFSFNTNHPFETEKLQNKQKKNTTSKNKKSNNPVFCFVLDFKKITKTKTTINANRERQ